MKARSARECDFDVVGLGQNSVDHLCQVEVFPRPGSKIEATDVRLLPGGQVATAMLAVRRQGLRACYLGAVGEDEMGAVACRELEQQGVETRLKVVAGGTTQYSIIVVDRSGERTIFEKYDPNTQLLAEDLTPEVFCSTRVLHLDITNVPAAVRAAGWAREAGALVSLDIDRLLPGTEELLPLVDLLVASEGLPEELGSPDPRLALHTLRRHSRQALVCITMGERGCVALQGEEALWVPAFKVKAADTTGCGDVFRGALIRAVLDGMPLPAMLRYASAAAALQATALGAQSGVPTREDVLAFLATGDGGR